MFDNLGYTFQRGGPFTPPLIRVEAKPDLRVLATMQQVECAFEGTGKCRFVGITLGNGLNGQADAQFPGEIPQFSKRLDDHLAGMVDGMTMTMAGGDQELTRAQQAGHADGFDGVIQGFRARPPVGVNEASRPTQTADGQVMIQEQVRRAFLAELFDFSTLGADLPNAFLS